MRRDPTRLATARHEAAHAVAALVLDGLSLAVVEIDCEGRSGVTDAIVTGDVPRSRAVFAAAGVEEDRLAGHGPEPGAAVDRRLVAQYAPAGWSELSADAAVVRAQLEARVLLRRHAAAVQRIADALYDRGALSGEACAALGGIAGAHVAPVIETTLSARVGSERRGPERQAAVPFVRIAPPRVSYRSRLARRLRLGMAGRTYMV